VGKILDAALLSTIAAVPLDHGTLIRKIVIISHIE
jgi:hypothetical protein